MASREITGDLLRVCFGAVRKESTPSKVLGWVLDELAVAQKDLDISGDMDDAMYYTGMVDAFEMVALWIAPLKREKEPQFNLMVDKTGTRFPEEKVA